MTAALRKPATDRRARQLPTRGFDVASLPERYAMKLTGSCLEPELMDGALVEF